MSDYAPKPEHKFTFGLWTVGNIGRDPFGGPTREPKAPAELVYLLGEVGAYGLNFQDNDLIPIDASPSKAEAIKKDFRKALDDVVCQFSKSNEWGIAGCRRWCAVQYEGLKIPHCQEICSETSHVI